MTMSALVVAVLIAWPAINLMLGGYAAWLATGQERRRRTDAENGPPGPYSPDLAGSDLGGPDLGGPDLGGPVRYVPALCGPGLYRSERYRQDAAEPVRTWWESLWWDAPGQDGAVLDPAVLGGAIAPWPAVATPQCFWIVVPCLNEERVVARTVRSALALSAPGADTRVLVVDDASDDGTPQVLAGIEDARLHVLRRELPDARRGKGEALNAAYAHIDDWSAAAGLDPYRVVVGVIDGDGRGSENLLTEVSAALVDPRIGAVQARVRIHDRDRLLGAVQDLEFGCIADASQMLRARIGSVGLGGNGQFARLSTLREFGPAPWSDCLVEDLELGLRLHLAGIGVGYVWRAAITQQGVVDMRRLLRQRTRWAQGNLQCVRYLHRLAAAPNIRTHTFLEMSYYLLAPWLNALSSVPIAALWVYAGVLLATGGAPVAEGSPAVGVGLWLVVLLLPGLSWAVLHRLRLRDERLGRCLVAGIVYPLFLLLGLASTWRALGRQLLGRNGWVKTERLAEEPVPAFAG